MGHRAVGVDDGEHPRGDRDRVSAETGRVSGAIEALVVVTHRGGDVVQGRQLVDQRRSDARVHLHERALVRRQRTGGEQDPFRDGDVADVAQERRGRDHLELVRAQIEPACDRAGEQRGFARLAAQDGVAGVEHADQHSHDCAVRVLQVMLEALTLQCGAGMVAERQQQVVVDVLEPVASVGAHDHAVEAPAQVQRDRDEVLDLGVRSIGCGFRRVLADDLVAIEHFPREALHDRAALRIVLEPVRAHEVEAAVGVLVGARQQQSLLGLHQLDRRPQDQLASVRVLLEPTARLVLALELRTQLGVPGALGPPAALQALDELAPADQFGLALAQRLPQTVPFTSKVFRAPLRQRELFPRSPHQHRARDHPRHSDQCPCDSGQTSHVHHLVPTLPKMRRFASFRRCLGSGGGSWTALSGRRGWSRVLREVAGRENGDVGKRGPLEPRSAFASPRPCGTFDRHVRQLARSLDIARRHFTRPQHCRSVKVVPQRPGSCSSTSPSWRSRSSSLAPTRPISRSSRAVANCSGRRK